METIYPQLKTFLESDEEKKILTLFHKSFLGDVENLFLYDTKTHLAKKVTVTKSPLGIDIASDDALLIIDIKNKPYVRYFEETYHNRSEENQHLIFSRYKDSEQEEQFSLAIQQVDLQNNEKITSSIHISRKDLLFDILDLENGRLYFSTLYIGVKNYMEWQKAKMRTILRPLYQTHSSMMEFFEETNPELKTLMNELLPHRFEDFAGAKQFKIYKK